MPTMAADQLFLECHFNGSSWPGSFSKDGGSYARQHFTEMTATLISLVLCAVFFVIYGLVRHHGTAAADAAAEVKLLRHPRECCESCRNRLRRVYAWDRSTDHYLLIASFATMQGLVFFLGATVEQPFQPMNMTNTTCVAQAVLFQFSVSALNAAVMAELVDMYLVLVMAVPVAEIRRRYTPGLVSFVFAVAVVFTVVPLALQYALGASLFVVVVVVGVVIVLEVVCLFVWLVAWAK
jgi:hypothetical protein